MTAEREPEHRPQVEPWLRGTLTDVPPVQRAVLHALQLCREDVERWVFSLPDEEMLLRPYGLPSLAFQVRHIARSLHRLMTYAEGGVLSETDLEALRTEGDGPVSVQALKHELQAALDRSEERIRRFTVSDLDQTRVVGRAHLPTTAAGLLVHCADHTQRHTGQVVTTAKVLTGLRGLEQS